MKVFVSYSRKDYVTVYAMVRELRRHGVSVWIDQDDIEVGVRWDDKLQSAIEEASHLLLMLSQSALKSQNVRDEFAFAITEGKAIIIALIDDVKLPLRLQRFQYIDFRNNYDRAFERLLQHLPNPDFISQDDSATVKHLTHEFPMLTDDDISNGSENEAPIAIRFAEDVDTVHSRRDISVQLRFEATGQESQSCQMNKHLIKIGRGSSCDVKLGDMKISREHVHLLKQNNMWYVKDIESSNGTWINQVEITGKTVQLKDGDVVKIANSVTMYVKFVSQENATMVRKKSFS
jgi:hypothetical protein